MLAGDSHAEFLGTPNFAGRPSVNLGIGGSRAIDCAAHLAALYNASTVPLCAAAAVLFIGANDLVRWRHPEKERAKDRFEDEVRRILQILEAWSAQVFVAALPPIGVWATSRDPAAVAPFSDRLQRLCAERRHTFFDPFAAMRDGGPGLARAGLHRDGVHLADYPRLAAEVSRLVSLRLALCRRLAEAPLSQHL